MLTATEYIPTSGVILAILWAEVLMYLSTGCREFFDDFNRRSPSWVIRNKQLNTYVWFLDTRGHKSHGALCMMMGLVALHALLEGKINRFEIEFIFVTVSLIAGFVFCILPPGPKAMPMMLFIPENYLWVLMMVFYSDLVRVEVIALSILFPLWGAFVFVRRSMKVDSSAYSIQRFSQEKKEFESTVGNRVNPFDEHIVR